MKQIQIQTVANALTVSGKAIDGATINGAALTIARNTAAAITADRNALIAAKTAHENAKTALANARSDRDAHFASARSFAVLTRDMLKPHLGTSHNALWSAAGFGTSLEVPSSPDAVVLVVESLAQFLTGRADLENAPLSITAANATTVAGDLLGANNLVKNRVVLAKNALTLRKEKYAAVRKRVRDLVKELAQLMGPLDPRWIDFGLNRPGILATPPTPTGLLAVLMGNGSISVKWSASPRAQYYRVWKKVIGLDEDLAPVGSPSDRDFAIDGLSAGATVELMVSAVNNGGESQRSEVYKVIMPA